MKKRMLRGLFVGGLMVGLWSTAAAACAVVLPDTGCPKGGNWELTLTSFVTSADNGNTADQNGDHWACRKPNPGRGAYTWKDNTNPLQPI